MNRKIVRILLLLTIIISVILIVVSFVYAIDGKDSAWAVMAASMAVITAVVSSWNAQRIVELEEDKQRPYPYPYFDFESRYGLVLLKVTNFGNSTAHDIEINFINELLNHKNESINFVNDAGEHSITVLLPQQSIAKTIDGHIQFYGMKKKHRYSGFISFANSTGKRVVLPFNMDAEMYAGTPQYAEEKLKTHFELQKIPGISDKMNVNLTNITKK